MKVHVTNLHGMAAASTAQIAQNNFIKALQPLDINEFGIYFYDASTEEEASMQARIDGINAGLSQGDIVIYQHPIWMAYRFEEAYLDKLRAYGAQLVIFVQDVIPLMFKANYADWIQPYIRLFNKADLVILPSKAMEKVLRENGLTVAKVVYQNLWDHPTSYQPGPIGFKRELTFLGSQDRFPFTKHWTQATDLRLFTQVNDPAPQPHVTYAGFVPEERLLAQLNRGFGLCWSENTPTQNERDYSRLNASYKLSTYLAAGMPVIANQDISAANIIRENGLGLLADSLDEVDHLVQTIDEAEYQQMVTRVRKFGELLRQGYIAKRILIATVNQLMAPNWEENND